MTLYKTNIKCNAGIDNGSIDKGRVYIGLFCVSVFQSVKKSECLIMDVSLQVKKIRSNLTVIVHLLISVSLLGMEKHSNIFF